VGILTKVSPNRDFISNKNNESLRSGGGKMKKLFSTIIYAMVLLLSLSASINCEEPFDIKGFYLGMNREEVKTIYDNFKKNQIAEYVSLEQENYRDLINLDNEFSSMGNKIEVAYDDSLKATNITFQYKTVAILFDYGNLDETEFVEAFRKDYKIPEMKFEDMGMVKTWGYANTEAGYKISIDDYKNVRLQVPKE
jgi:hypothetical protein